MVVLNKKGQVIFYSLMLGMVIIVLALAFAKPARSFVVDAMSPDNLNCSSSTISTFDKAGCLAIDLTLPMFILSLVFIGVAVITAKIIFT